MTRAEQRRFVRDLSRNVTKNILENAKHWPDTWDGYELRQLLAEAFADASFTFKEHRGRARAYRNVLNTTPRLW